jgi:hypothetical protein
MGFLDGQRTSKSFDSGIAEVRVSERIKLTKPKRKLSAWNKFVKANSKKKIYRYANGKLKLKKMGIAFRKKKRR